MQNPEIKEIFETWQETRNEENVLMELTIVNDSEDSKILPDGSYLGRVFIYPEKADNPDSLNYGRTMYVFELSIVDENFNDKIVRLPRVLLPHYLANKPPESDAQAIKTWRTSAKNYLRETDRLLEKCGVDVLETDPTLFVKKIANNNLSKPIVIFESVNGNIKIRQLVKRENEKALFAELQPLPDGNDAPI